MLVKNFRLKMAVQTAVSLLREVADLAVLHPEREMRRQALDDTVSYLRSLPRLPPSFTSGTQLLKHAIKEAELKGSIVELGVYKGSTIRFIARRVPSNRRIYGFDTFTGLPDAWIGHRAMFDAGGILPRVPANVELHKGLFDDTLPCWAQEQHEPIALLHVDCDLYTSTASAFAALWPLITEGTVIVFDEYFNYPEWRQHEFKAFQEFVERHCVEYTYLGYARVQAAVRIERMATA